jgi:transposase InsO family protein
MSAVTDLFSRGLVDERQHDSPVDRDALLMAIWRRGKPDALMHHSDRGSHTPANSSSARWPTAASFAHEPIRQRLGQRGMESFFSPLKTERIEQERGQSRCVRLNRAFAVTRRSDTSALLNSSARWNSLNRVSIKPAAAQDRGRRIGCHRAKKYMTISYHLRSFPPTSCSSHTVLRQLRRVFQFFRHFDSLGNIVAY